MLKRQDYVPLGRCVSKLLPRMGLPVVIFLATAFGQLYADSPSSLMIRPPPMIEDEIDPNCWNFTYGNWRIQEFYTPNYPGEYLNNTDCVLYLEAPPGFKIQLDFRDRFVLEKSEGCKYDYLEVRDGPFAYSPLVSRYCNAEFPPIITSSGRHLWMRFKTDDLLQYGGFRAVYSYHKDHTQNDGAVVSKGERQPSSQVSSGTCRIPIKLSPDEADGILSSEDVPYPDVQDPNVSKGQNVDCTWELYTNRGHGIQLRSMELDLRSRKRCDINNVTVYERTTLESSIKEEYCRGSNERVDVTSDSNRLYVRLYGSSLSNKPNVKMIYTLVRKGECSELEFRCGDLCLPASLMCNGIDNCRDKSDEIGCNRAPKGRLLPSGSGARGDGKSVARKPTDYDDRTHDSVNESAAESSIIPLHIIILGAVGGVIITCVSISLCVVCLLRKKDRDKRQEVSRQKSSQRNALEMAVCNSSSTSVSLSRQNNESHGGHRTGGGSDRQHYVTFSKMTPTSPTSGKSDSHRYSMSDRTMPPVDVDIIPEQMTESGNYKRFLSMEITPEDITDDSIKHGLYPPSPGGVMGMSKLDRRGVTDGYQGYHGSQWHPNLKEEGIIYPYGSSSLTRPSPFLGMSKPFSCSQPENKYECMYPKALKATENEGIKEHQSS